MDSNVLYLGLGGLIGSALRAAITTDQKTFSRQTIADVIIGGAIGVLYPLYPLIPLPESASLLQRAVIMGMLAYSTSDFATNMFARLQTMKKEGKQ